MEKTKYEISTSKPANIHHPKKNFQRKLNYASSKCGAKILTSNPEAKHRISILNEKPDEYMLNPCRVRTWFIIELCDTVEATQIELANYELYSSSPRVFSVHWSGVYPTSEWHLLGTFEAKDQRTMQTFDINMKNLGKFIKVIIYNHHGKEHYCLMSVIRVIGYSMVEKFEGIDETEENNLPDKRSEPIFARNLTSEEERNIKRNFQEKKKSSKGYAKRLYPNLCSLYLTHCKYLRTKNDEKSCPNKQVCQFFSEVFPNLTSSCDKFLCFSNILLDVFNSSYEKEFKNLTTHFFLPKIKLKNDSVKKVTLSTHESAPLKFHNIAHSLEKKNDDSDLHELDRNLTLNAVKENLSMGVMQNKKFTQNEKAIYGEFIVPAETNNREKCVCEQERNGKKFIQMDDKVMSEYDLEQLPNFEMTVDSAGLIQKESVLIKLTTRIKTSEIDLDLINKYLQQLSQSYRQQMHDMQNIFNQTVKAINAASEVSMIIDKKQQESINALQKKVISLTRKVEYLMSGQRDLLKRVVEMHAFFLILEIIIISTIFTIFMNVFRRKNAFPSRSTTVL